MSNILEIFQDSDVNIVILKFIEKNKILDHSLEKKIKVRIAQLRQLLGTLDKSIVNITGKFEYCDSRTYFVSGCKPSILLILVQR
jgi:hypothetical protein